jgi:vancomycin resistance protein YoaR
VILLLAMLGGIGYASVTAQNSEEIYPNVMAYGIDFGGMTPPEAEAALRNADGFDMYADARVTVNFPGDLELTVVGAEVGLSSDAAVAASKLFAIGRGGGFISNGLNYLRCIIAPRNVEFSDGASLNSEAIRKMVAEIAVEVNREIMDNTLNVGETTVTIIKGSNSVLVDEAQVCTLIERALLERSYDDIMYQPYTSEPKQIDLDDVMRIVYRAPESAKYDGAFNVTPEVIGRTFDIDAAKAKLDSADFGDKVVIPLQHIEPEHTKPELEAMLFRDVLAEKTTKLTSNATRSTNVELAANSVNETVLLPGAVFSYNDTVGERTRDRGYGAAPAYADSEVVMEVGGGICQVSSTIYYCTLLANLEIVERYAHTFATSYLPLGMDATVSWGGPNFRFRNNSDYPIKILSKREGSELIVSLLGTKLDDTYVEMTYSRLRDIPPKTKYIEDAGILPGQMKVKTNGTTGCEVKTYRTLFDADGNQISRKTEASSIYQGHKQEVLVAMGELALYPTDGSSPSVTPSPSGSDLPGAIVSPSESAVPPSSGVTETPASSEPTSSGGAEPSSSTAPEITDAPGVESPTPSQGLIDPTSEPPIDTATPSDSPIL